ncbi:50S ribosomal protein L31 [Gammaproteobacteria bacterium]|nr:50S ribosomal protein L31 [Gammaproteobacteria bacterium]
MKRGIHPNTDLITATCTCGEKTTFKSTLCKDINIDICAKCHPFYTGKQKNIDSGGRINKFKQRFQSNTK